MSFEQHDDTIIVNKFNEDSAREFRKRVFKASSADPSMPIVVYIDSYGGYVDALNNMLATMRMVPNKFVTVCVGKAMSAGAALLAAGDFRFCDVGSRIMIHELSGGAVGSIDDIKTDAKESDRLNLQLMTDIATRCGKTYKELKQIIKDNEGRDLYLTADQAKEFGIVDFIGLPAIKPVVMYAIETLPEKKYEKIDDMLTKIEESPAELNHKTVKAQAPKNRKTKTGSIKTKKKNKK